MMIAESKAMQRCVIAHVLASCEADIRSYQARGYEVPIQIKLWSALARQRLQAMDKCMAVNA